MVEPLRLFHPTLCFVLDRAAERKTMNA